MSRAKVNQNVWTELVTTSVDTLLTAEGDLRVFFVTGGGAAPATLDDGHVLANGQAMVVPFGLTVYVRARQGDAYVVNTVFGV